MTEGLVAVWEDPISMEEMEGIVVNSAWCPVTSKWNILVAAFDGTFKTINSDMLGLNVYPGFSMENKE